MREFDTNFQKFSFKRARAEADAGCKLLSEPAVGQFSAEEIENFDYDEYYSKLLTNFPTLMTPMVASTATGSFEDGTLEVLRSIDSHLFFVYILLRCLPQLPGMVRREGLLTCVVCSSRRAAAFSTTNIPNKLMLWRSSIHFGWRSTVHQGEITSTPTGSEMATAGRRR